MEYNETIQMRCVSNGLHSGLITLNRRPIPAVDEEDDRAGGAIKIEGDTYGDKNFSSRLRA